jgi:hypothetical protein
MRSLILFLLVVIVQYGFSQTVVNFTSPGAQTWVCPPNVSQITVQCWGGGGSGISGGGPGGGGGAFASKSILVTPGTSYYMYVGGSGQSSWFNSVNVTPNSNAMVLADFGKSSYSSNNSV